MSKRAEGATVASLRDAGIPPEAVRRYLEQLGLPKHDVRYDLPRIRRYAIETIAALPDEELAARVGVPVSAVPGPARRPRSGRGARARGRDPEPAK